MDRERGGGGGGGGRERKINSIRSTDSLEMLRYSIGHSCRACRVQFTSVLTLMLLLH